MLYGCETWIIHVGEWNRIKAFEIWCYRKMLRISWTEHVTNEEMLQRAGESSRNQTKESPVVGPCFEARKPAAYGHRGNDRWKQLQRTSEEGVHGPANGRTVLHQLRVPQKSCRRQDVLENDVPTTAANQSC